MNSIFGVSGNNSSSNWFSSMLGGSSSSSSSTSFSSSLISDWSMIKNGTYYKLAKQYYGKGTTDTEDAKTQSAENKTEKIALTNAKSNAAALQKAADALVTTDEKKSVFNLKEVTDEETGITTKQYDTEAIYKAVKNFVDSYNEVVKNTIDSDTVSVLRKTLNMVNNTKANENLLEKKLGITIKEDNTLEIDEEKFKAADMGRVKSLFNGLNSLADRVSRSAGDIVSLATNALKNMGSGTTYSGSGSYNATASSVGTSYDDFL